MPAPSLPKKDSKILNRYRAYFGDNISLLYKSKEGLPAEAVFDFLQLSGMVPRQAEQVLHKSMKTFQNYRDNKLKLDTQTSEKILKLFGLYQKGDTVFGGLEEFRTWLSRPAYGIGEQIPESLLDTVTGIHLVMEELIRIEYGDLS